MYVIWDRIAQAPVGKAYVSRKRALTRAHKLDLEYGAYRYYVKNRGC